jgi:hypothetical protein
MRKEIKTIKLKFTNNYMVCVQLPCNKFKYFNSDDYKSLIETQRVARIYSQKLNSNSFMTS